MIANSVELKVAVRQLRIIEKAFKALRTELEASNPRLLEITSKAYVRRIALLQSEITQYLAEHPAEVSLILPPLEAAVAAIETPSAPSCS